MFLQRYKITEDSILSPVEILDDYFLKIARESVTTAFSSLPANPELVTRHLPFRIKDDN